MKFGVREICDVVLRAKSRQKIGSTTFEKDEPVLYFDSLKTSTVEGAASTVYATGGRGNSRLIAWEGERTVTFTMEDALISPLGFAILSGAGLISPGVGKPLNVHMTSQVACKVVAEEGITVDLTNEIPSSAKLSTNGNAKIYGFVLDGTGAIKSKLTGFGTPGAGASDKEKITFEATAGVEDGATILVDYYVEVAQGATQLEVTPDKFAGNYYLEANTLFRRQDTGQDMPAVFVVPNVKIQSAFNFSLASSGDPSTFTFTMDAFPDYTKFDMTKKVLFAIQIIEEYVETEEAYKLV